MDPLSLFLVSPPGLAHIVADEARASDFKVTAIEAAGVSIAGDWVEAMRANLLLRGPTRVLARVAEFRVMHLAQLDKRARKLPWSDWLRPDVPVKVEASCRKSRIYHDRAAGQRIERAIAETLGAKVDAGADLRVVVRIEDDLCTVSLDTSGTSLHKRGLKAQVNKAPMRETLASLFLRSAGFDGTAPLVDPMCGSGTFVIEAAEIAAGLAPGRARSFTFEKMSVFDPEAWTEMKDALPPPRSVGAAFHGSDRDAGAIAMSRANAERAGVADITRFDVAPVTEARPPEGQTGLVIVNPPYGGRIGKTGALHGLYATYGETMRTHFAGWRIALITTEAGLARAAGLDWEKPGPIVDHGGTKIRMWQTEA